MHISNWVDDISAVARIHIKAGHYKTAALIFVEIAEALARHAAHAAQADDVAHVEQADQIQ